MPRWHGPLYGPPSRHCRPFAVRCPCAFDLGNKIAFNYSECSCPSKRWSRRRGKWRKGKGAGRCLKIASFIRGEASLLCAFLSSLNQLQLLLCIACCLLLHPSTAAAINFQFSVSVFSWKMQNWNYIAAWHIIKMQRTARNGREHLLAQASCQSFFALEFQTFHLQYLQHFPSTLCGRIEVFPQSDERKIYALHALHFALIQQMCLATFCPACLKLT